MARQTAFPGILVESIKAEKPPFDEPGVVQEFVGRGVTRKFEDLTGGMDLTPDRIQEILNEFEETIGPLRDTFKVRYNLLIRATPIPKRFDIDVAKGAQEFGVSLRARTFVRAKNPFEPDVLEVGEPSIDKGMTKQGTGTIYRVPVWVTK